MKNIIKVLVISLLILSCKAQEAPTQFSEEAMSDTFITMEGDSITFKDILETHKGSTMLIDVWASWCGDCLKGIPKLKELQKEYKDATYVFLSLDRGEDAWKRGIEKYKIQGNHYYMQSGRKGAFGSFVDLDWIPRYMVVDREGNIKMFKAVEADDIQIIELL